MSAVAVLDMPPSSSPLDTQPRPQVHASCIAPDALLHNAEQEALVIEVDALLMQEQWAWVRKLVESVPDAKTRQEAKFFFLKLVKANTLDAMDAVLNDLDTWRSSLQEVSAGGNSHKRVRRQLKAVSRTLFLLGADKQLELLRTTVGEEAKSP